MNSEFRQEIEFGLENLERVLTSISTIAAQDIPQIAQDPALAYECLGYYNALEHLILRFLKQQGIEKPSGQSSHRDALRAFEKLLIEIESPLDENLSSVMTELMGFRHVATKIYGFLIDHDRLRAVVKTIVSNHVGLRLMVRGALDKIDPQ
jgi:hypothetical protein